MAPFTTTRQALMVALSIGMWSSGAITAPTPDNNATKSQSTPITDWHAYFYPNNGCNGAPTTSDGSNTAHSCTETNDYFYNVEFDPVAGGTTTSTLSIFTTSDCSDDGVELDGNYCSTNDDLTKYYAYTVAFDFS